MTTKKFWELHNLNKGLKPSESKNFYRDEDGNLTEDHIIYIRLDEAVDDQDFLVLSRNAAKALVAKTTPFAEMQVTKGDNGKWGIIMPDSSKKLDIDLFQLLEQEPQGSFEGIINIQTKRSLRIEKRQIECTKKRKIKV